jgi:ABC-2 type transport system permease protein
MRISNILNHHNRILLRELIITDFKLRYQGSFLGYLWSLLKPLFLFSILYTVFGIILKFGGDVEHYPLYLLLGIVLWGFFTEATNNGLTSIVSRGELIRKINFPKYIIVISGTISALINLALNLVVVAVFMIINGVDIHRYILLFPLIVLELYVLSLAIAFYLSALYVKFRDIAYLWEIGLQALFYATPIFYTLSLVLEKTHNLLIAQILLLNPVAQIIQDARYTLITPQTKTLYQLVSNPFVIAIPFAIVIGLAVVASVYFKSKSKYFAEEV